MVENPNLFALRQGRDAFFHIGGGDDDGILVIPVDAGGEAAPQCGARGLVFRGDSHADGGGGEFHEDFLHILIAQGMDAVPRGHGDPLAPDPQAHAEAYGGTGQTYRDNQKEDDCHDRLVMGAVVPAEGHQKKQGEDVKAQE